MKTFTDNAGRTWTLALTVNSLKRVKGLAQIDLANVLQARPEREVPLLAELEEDLLLFAETLFALVQPQAAQTGVSQEEFDRACGGAVLAEAQRVFWEELVDFFRSLPHREAHLRAIELLSTLKQQLVTSALQEMDEALKSPAPKGPKTSGERSADWPASSASIPAP